MKAVKVLNIILAVLLIVFTFLHFYRLIEVEDIGWHLATGRWIFEHTQVPHLDPFSFVAPPAPWVFTQWLGSLIYYLVYHNFGYIGLKLYRALFFMLILGVFILYSRRKMPFLCLILVGYCFAHTLGFRCLLRPDIYNYFFIQIVLIILFLYKRDYNAKLLLSLPLIGLIWGNLHLGSFVYGSFVIGLFIFDDLIKMLNLRFGKEKNIDKYNSYKKSFSNLSITLILYVLSLSCSPYGFAALLYPFKVFLMPAFINFYKFNKYIMEMQPPTYILSLNGIPIVVLFALSVFSLWIKKEGKFILTVLFAVSFFAFLYSARGVGIYAIACVYIIAESKTCMFLNERLKKNKHYFILSLFAMILLILLFILDINRCLNYSVYIKGKLTRVIQKDFTPFNPSSSVKFLLDNNITGVVFTNDIVGGQIVWEGFPKLIPFVDGRQINQEIFMNYMYMWRQPEKYWPVAQQMYNIKIVLLDSSVGSSAYLLKYLSSSSDWQLVFIDGSFVVYVRKGAFDLSSEIMDFQAKFKNIKINQQDIMSLENVIKDNTLAKKSKIRPMPTYIDDLEEGVTLYDLGFKGAGVAKILKAYPINPQKTRPVIESVLKALREENN